MMRITSSLCLLLLSAAFQPLAAQESRFAKNRPGVWIIENHISKCENRVDVAAFTKNVTGVAEWFHQNDALVTQPKGFDARVSLNGDPCEIIEPSTVQFYGNRGFINFMFRYFYYDQGVLTTATDWLAHDTDIQINNPIYHVGHACDEHGWETGNNPALKEPFEKALQNIRQLYDSPKIRKVIAPGVDLYEDGTIVVSNSARPPFWTPVTLKEVMEIYMAFYKISKQIGDANAIRIREQMAKLGMKTNPADKMISVYDEFARQYAAFRPEELGRPAFKTPGSDPTFYNSNGHGMQVVRFNPECWDRRLPRSSIQFVSFSHAVQAESELKDFIVRNGGLSHYVALFHNALPIEKLNALIEKK